MVFVAGFRIVQDVLLVSGGTLCNTERVPTGTIRQLRTPRLDSNKADLMAATKGLYCSRSHIFEV